MPIELFEHRWLDVSCDRFRWRCKDAAQEAHHRPNGSLLGDWLVNIHPAFDGGRVNAGDSV